MAKRIFLPRKQQVKLGAAALGFVLLSAAWGAYGWFGEGGSEAPIRLHIAQGSSLGVVERQLQAAGALRSGLGFQFGARLLGGGGAIKAGEFRIPAHASAAAIYALIAQGRSQHHNVMIPEGMPAIMVQARLQANGELHGDVAMPQEGSILPASYDYQTGASRADILAHMQEAMREALAEEWQDRASNAVVKTPQEALTLASIVEKETAKPEERAMVAGVYSNRLRMGMKLDADPTVIYPVTHGRALGQRITRSQLRDNNPYNTYMHAGLPPGPITNPGREALHAALHPAETKALYFVADGSGGHVFAETLAEQNAHVAHWRTIHK
jgi:UPF0755 protein